MQRSNGLLVSVLLLGLASLGSSLSENEACSNPAGQSGRCIYFRECEPLLQIYNKPIISPEESRFIENSRCGFTADRRPLVCCAVTTPVRAGGSAYTLPKPPQCGKDFSDRIVGGQATGLDEFPWTALIEYRKPNGRTGFHCGASLINSRYVLTAAHCIKAIPRGWEPIGVRLGEWDLDKPQDCVDGDCSDAPVNMGIEKITVHEEYNPQNKAQYNDIALIRFTRDVQFSSYISPVCLPFENAQRSKNNVGTKGVATGWGRTETASASNVKLKVELEIKDLQGCANTYRPSGINLRDTQVCAGGVRGQDTCSGDSGGPLTKLDRASHYLYGIVSFGPNKCGTKGVPGVYTNVPKYIDWIERNMQ